MKGLSQQFESKQLAVSLLKIGLIYYLMLTLMIIFLDNFSAVLNELMTILTLLHFEILISTFVAFLSQSSFITSILTTLYEAHIISLLFLQMLCT